LTIQQCDKDGTLTSCDVQILSKVYCVVLDSCSKEEALLCTVEPVMRALETAMTEIARGSRTARSL